MPVVRVLVVGVAEREGLHGHRAELRDHSRFLQRVEVGLGLQARHFGGDHAEHLRRMLDGVHDLRALGGGPRARVVVNVHAQERCRLTVPGVLHGLELMQGLIEEAPQVGLVADDLVDIEWMRQQPGAELLQVLPLVDRGRLVHHHPS